MIKSAWISALVLAMGAAFASSVGAQTVNGSNYRQYARCVEVVSNGKVYSTFGPGPCPPGTKSSPSYGSYENDLAMRRTQGSVAALGQAQQAVGQSFIAMAQARAKPMIDESNRILATLYIDLDDSYDAETNDMYSNAERVFPDIGRYSISESGGILISTQSGQYTECIVPSFSFEKKAMGGWTYSIVSGEPACKIRQSDPSFSVTYANSVSSVNGGSYIIPIEISNKNGNFDVCLKTTFATLACKKGVLSNEMSIVVGFLGDRSLTKDVVSYAGIRGDSLLFLYRPGGFPDQSRPDRVVEVTANLSESRVVKVGPYTFEVVDWSPANIVAKLVAVD